MYCTRQRASNQTPHLEIKKPVTARRHNVSDSSDTNHDTRVRIQYRTHVRSTRDNTPLLWDVFCPYSASGVLIGANTLNKTRMAIAVAVESSAGATAIKQQQQQQQQQQQPTATTTTDGKNRGDLPKTTSLTPLTWLGMPRTVSEASLISP